MVARPPGAKCKSLRAKLFLPLQLIWGDNCTSYARFSEKRDSPGRRCRGPHSDVQEPVVPVSCTSCNDGVQFYSHRRIHSGDAVAPCPPRNRDSHSNARRCPELGCLRAVRGEPTAHRLVPTSDDTLSRSGLRAAARSCVDSPWTWHALGFLLLRSAVGVLVIVLIFVLAGAIELLSAPVRYPTTVEFGQVNGQPVTWTIDTLPGAVGGAAAGAIGVVIVLHISNGVAYASKRMAEALLDTSD